MTIGEANAVNVLARFISGDAAYADAGAVENALSVLLPKARKVLGAGLSGSDVTWLVGKGTVCVPREALRGLVRFADEMRGYRDQLSRAEQDASDDEWEHVVHAIGVPGIEEVFPCGHLAREQGCGGCDPGAIDLVIEDDGTQRPPYPHETTIGDQTA